MTGRLPLPRLMELMELADIAISLRPPTGGETSATCVRLLGLGKPVIVNTGDWFSDIPAGCCARIDPGRFEDEELVSVLDALASSPPLRHDMGLAAARWARAVHQLERSVEGYAGFIEETIREAPGVYSPVARLAPYPPSDVPTALAVELDTAAADLGISEYDRELLPALAMTLEELGLTGR